MASTAGIKGSITRLEASSGNRGRVKEEGAYSQNGDSGWTRQNDESETVIGGESQCWKQFASLSLLNAAALKSRIVAISNVPSRFDK